jgi:hypothetical protein
MASYGSLFINDGIMKDASSREGFSSFEMSLFCTTSAGGLSYLVWWRSGENAPWRKYGMYSKLYDAETFAESLVEKKGGETRISDYPRIDIPYSKTIKRIVSLKNPIAKAKTAVSEYAGCDEASMVRKRAIAMASRRVSISGEEFRFRLP